MASSGIGLSLDDVIKQNRKIKKETGGQGSSKKKPTAGAKSRQTRVKTAGKANTRARKLVQQRGQGRNQGNASAKLISTVRQLKVTNQILKAALTRNRVGVAARRVNGSGGTRAAQLAAALGIRRKAANRVRAQAIRGANRIYTGRGRRAPITPIRRAPITPIRRGVRARVGTIRGRGGRSVPVAASSDVRSRLGWQGRQRGAQRGRRSMQLPSTSAVARVSAIQRQKQTKGRGNVGGMQSDVVYRQASSSPRSSAMLRGRGRGGRGNPRGLQLVSWSSRQREGQQQRPQRNNNRNAIAQRQPRGLFTRGRRSGGLTRDRGSYESAGVLRNERSAPAARRDTRPPPRRTANTLPPVRADVRQAFARESTGLSLNERFGGGDRVRVKERGRQIYL